jgi:hypothetical protein
MFILHRERGVPGMFVGPASAHVDIAYVVVLNGPNDFSSRISPTYHNSQIVDWSFANGRAGPHFDGAYLFAPIRPRFDDMNQ